MEKAIQGDFLLTPQIRFPAKISNFFRLEVRARENQGILGSERMADRAEEANLRKGSRGISLERFSGVLGFRLAEHCVKRTEVPWWDRAGFRSMGRPVVEGEADLPLCLQCPGSCGPED